MTTKSLSRAAKKLKKGILEVFPMDDQASLSILDAALESFDLWHEAQEQVDREGLTCEGDRGGTKSHPLLAVIRDQKNQFLRAVQLLHLDLAGIESKPVGRPSEYDRYHKGKIYQGPSKFGSLVGGRK